MECRKSRESDTGVHTVEGSPVVRKTSREGNPTVCTVSYAKILTRNILPGK